MAPGLTETRKHKLMGMLKLEMTVLEISKATGVSRVSLYAILKRYDMEEGCLKRKKGQGRKKTKNTQVMIDKVHKRTKKNPWQSNSSLAKAMGVPRITMRRVVSSTESKSVTPLLQHDIMPGQEARWLERVKKLLSWCRKAIKKSKVAVWSDEILFYAKTHINKQNNCILIPLICTDSSVRIVRRAKNPSKVMVFLANTSDGQVMLPILFPPDCKVNSKVYQELVLTKVVTWMSEKNVPGDVIFQQNGAPAHTSKARQAT